MAKTTERYLGLKNKHIIIAGAGTDIGLAISELLFSLGVRLTLLDRSDSGKGAQTKFYSQSCTIACLDYFSISTIELQIEEIKKSVGPFDGIVYCDGVGGVRPLNMSKPSFVADMMQANVFAFIELARCLTKNHGIRESGSIVAISSISSIKGLKSKIAYSASKAALDGAIRSMAAELGEKKIRVNSVLKGWVTSDMKQDFIQNSMAISDQADFRRQFLGAISPSEIARLVAFLLSDEVLSITGTSITLDGGYSL